MFSPGGDDHDYWMEFNQQQLGEGDLPSMDSINHAGSGEISGSTNIDHGSRSRGGGGGASPPAKPMRRRSRASKKTPTTILNANANNFRALVQQFTGCPSTALSFKGPVNLSFSSYKDHHTPQEAGAGIVNNSNNDSYLYNNTASSSGSASVVSVSVTSSSYGKQRSVSQPIITTDRQGSSSLYSYSNISMADATMQGSTELDTSFMSLDQGGFATMDRNDSSAPNSFSW